MGDRFWQKITAKSVPPEDAMVTSESAMHALLFMCVDDEGSI